jgi:hypothetical protein
MKRIGLAGLFSSRSETASLSKLFTFCLSTQSKYEILILSQEILILTEIVFRCNVVDVRSIVVSMSCAMSAMAVVTTMICMVCVETVASTVSCGSTLSANQGIVA